MNVAQVSLITGLANFAAFLIVVVYLNGDTLEDKIISREQNEIALPN